MRVAIFLITVATVSASANASEEDIRVVCNKTSDADLGKYKLYKTPPKTLDEHAMNVLMGGLSGLLVEKPNRVAYVIKKSENRIENTDRTSNFGGAKIEINGNHIQAISANNSMRMNRLTGEMTHTFMLPEETVDAWKNKHGGTPPIIGTWRYQCNKASPAF